MSGSRTHPHSRPTPVYSIPIGCPSTQLTDASLLYAERGWEGVGWYLLAELPVVSLRGGGLEGAPHLGPAQHPTRIAAPLTRQGLQVHGLSEGGAGRVHRGMAGRQGQLHRGHQWGTGGKRDRSGRIHQGEEARWGVATVCLLVLVLVAPCVLIFDV
jgi:hypothetical protein